MTTEVDYYELLECERTADDATLKSSYRKLAMKYHPDKNGGCKDHEARVKAISEAYECLKDPQKRAAYDRFGHAAFRNGGGPGHGAQDFSGFSDIFESVFGEFMGGRGGRPNLRGADLRYDMEISLEDAYHGKASEITVDVSGLCDSCTGTGATPGTQAHQCKQCNGHGKVRAQQGFFMVERTCPVCHGAGEVIADPCRDCRGEGRTDKTKTLSINVPPGVDEGTRIRLTGEGEAGARGGPPGGPSIFIPPSKHSLFQRQRATPFSGAPSGDLYIFIHVSKHSLFERQGTTLFAHAPISFTTAALGGEIVLPALDGEKISVKIAPGTQAGREVRHRGAGMPVLQGRGRG